MFQLFPWYDDDPVMNVIMLVAMAWMVIAVLVLLLSFVVGFRILPTKQNYEVPDDFDVTPLRPNPGITHIIRLDIASFGRTGVVQRFYEFEYLPTLENIISAAGELKTDDYEVLRVSVTEVDEHTNLGALALDCNANKWRRLFECCDACCCVECIKTKEESSADH